MRRIWLVVLLLFTGCSSCDETTQPVPQGLDGGMTGTVGPEGGTLVFELDTGTVMIEVPSGAVTELIEITVRPTTAEDGTLLALSDLLFDIEVDGVLEVPATITYPTGQEATLGGTPGGIMFVPVSDGPCEGGSTVTFDPQTGAVTVERELSGSAVCGSVPSTGYTFCQPDVGGTVDCQTGDGQGTYALHDDAVTASAACRCELIAEEDCELSGESEGTTQIGARDEPWCSVGPTLTCEPPDDVEVCWQTCADRVTLDDGESQIDCGGPVCWKVCVGRDGEPAPPPYAYLDTVLDGCEGICDCFDATPAFSQGSGLQGTRRLVTVAGSNGWIILDPDTGESWSLDLASTTGYYGAAALWLRSGQAAFWEVLVFGPGGLHSVPYDPVLGEFGFTQVYPNSGNVTDVAPFMDDFGSGGAVWVSNSNNVIQFFVLSASATLAGTAPVIAADRFPGASGAAVSAFARDLASGVMFVTDGEPGELWFLADPGGTAAAVRIGEVGSRPLRVRERDGIHATMNHLSRTLSIGVRDASGVRLTATADVGDGVGIDLKSLPDGNVAIASSGLTEGTYSITIVDPSGAVVSNDTYPSPADCPNPGHVLWLPGDDDVLLLSCNTSGKITRLTLAR